MSVVLFDPAPRSDPSPARHEEGTFDFLNRVADPYFASVRRTLDRWFERLPAHAKTSFRARMRRRGWRSGFWELYLHEMLRRLDLAVRYEPELDDSPRNPDFLIDDPAGRSCVIEAVSLDKPHEDDAAERRRAQILDALNRTTSPDFFLWLEFEAEGTEAPSVARFRPGLEAWLRGLDTEDVIRQYEEGGMEALSSYVWEDRGWRVAIWPVPKNPEARGDPNHRPVGAHGPSQAYLIDDRSVLLQAMKRKATGYGDLGRPFVIALDFHSLFGLEEEDVEGVLYGRTVDRTWLPAGHPDRIGRLRDGFWAGPGGPKHTRVSAVIVMWGLEPWTPHKAVPTLWHNPWAARPLEVPLPWCVEYRFDPESGKVAKSPSEVPPGKHLDLPAEWPTSEGPFAGR